MSKIKKPTVKIVLMKHKTLQNGEHPVALRVTYDRKSMYSVLKGGSKTLTCSLNKWNQEFGRYNRNKDLNILLNAYDKKANDVLDGLSDTDFTFSRFESNYFRKRGRTNVFEFIAECIESLRTENRLGSAETYLDTSKRLIEFTKAKKITFHDIDEGFLKRFRTFLTKKGNSISTIGIFLRSLRAVFNMAIKENHVSSDLYPFKDFKIQKGKAVRRALTKDSIDQLRGYSAEKGSIKWHSLNYFIFSYLARGMNFKDLASLKWRENTQGDKLFYLRAKTLNTVNDPEYLIINIEPEIAQILSHYSNNDPYIFPVLQPGLSELTKRHRIKDTLKKVNKQLKEVAKEIGLPEVDQITFYWARHTYATVLKRAGESTAIISEALGHSNEKTTQAYLDKFENKQLDETYKHLI